MPPRPRPRPLLFLDVDGPLNPYAAQPERRPAGYTTLRATPTPDRGPFRVWLNPAHGPSLLALPYDLVWATTWMSHANTWIALTLNLPPLPHVDFGPDLLVQRPDEIHWKTPHLLTYAAGRPFAWVDDEHSPADTEYIHTHHPTPALLHHVNPRLGLREGDFRALEEWARGEATA